MPSTPPGKARPRDARTRRRAPRPPEPRGEVELRLAIGRDGLGIELARPTRLGCLELTELGVIVPHVKFPVDVSGGVERFRHRRGRVERITFELSSDALARELARSARGILGEQVPRVWVAVRPWGGTIGICDEESGRALAFDVAIDPFEDELRLVPFAARGIRLPAPAVALAARVMSSLLGKRAKREGVRFVLEQVPDRVTRALMPEAGARAPDCAGARITAATCAADAWIIHVSLGVAAAPSEAAVRARETSELTREADDARFDGDLERARALDLYCLERAPRHPEVCARIADIDRLASGRAEAAREILADADDPSLVRALAGELALEAGDATRAAAALLRAAEEEQVPALAAFELERAASVAPDTMQRLEWLDRAIARAPSLATVHWTRCAARLAAGRLRDAIADVEGVEALARGAAAKHAVWRRAATVFAERGHVAEARSLFERALRFVPDDPQALAGLGSTMIAQGKVARGAALLSRALQQADRARRPSAEMSLHALALARALAEHLGDRPAAIARVRSIGNADPDAALARGLEGRWRAALGDKAGASLAFAQMRDLCVSASPDAVPDESRELLLEAASFERKHRDDTPSAQAHLATALRLFPRDATVAQVYREALSGDAPRGRVAEDGVRADELLTRHRATPDDGGLLEELTTLLVRLGRTHEALALLSAPRHIETLGRLEREARSRGHDHDAQLFRDAIRRMGGSIDA